MAVNFELKATTDLPLDIRSLNPESILGLSEPQIRNLKIGIGNRVTEVSRWFDISVGDSDQTVIFRGDLVGVHAIGHSMSEGRIEVFGSAGRHVGDSMSGGEIVVHGDVGDYAGFEMLGGTLVVKGNAADHLGGCFPGAKFGMNRGVILIQGSAGEGAGYRMRRGTIVVGGDVGDLAAWQMRAGTFVVFGHCHGAPGIDMKRGTIYAKTPGDISPTFSKGGQVSPGILNMLSKWIDSASARYGLQYPAMENDAAVFWHGDQLAGGRGELIIPTDS